MSFLKKLCCILAFLLLIPLPAAAEKHKHSVKNWTVTEEPTCTEPGSRYGLCSECGKKVVRIVEAAGHTFGPWTQCRENVRTRACTVCGTTELAYTFDPEKEEALRVLTPGTAQTLTLELPAAYTGDTVLILPAGDETELQFSVPGGTPVQAEPVETDTGLYFMLPDKKEEQSPRFTVPARERPVTVTVHMPADVPESLTLQLPETGETAELLFPAPLTLTVTGQDAGKTSVKPAVPEIRASLISSDVLEIEYPEPVCSQEEAETLFTVTVGGAPAEWEYLTYFDFGPYGERGGVVSLKLLRALDIGQPAMYADGVCIAPSTQEENGPAAAAAVRVSFGEQTVEASFDPFWAGIRYIEESGAAVWVAKGAQDAVLPEEENGLTVHLLGADRSVYEDPDCRGLYAYGRTRDTFSRASVSGADGSPTVVKADGAK